MTMDYRPPARITVKAGGRGAGKTYAATRWALDRALENRGTRIAVVSSLNDREYFLDELAEASSRAGVSVDYRASVRSLFFENGSVIVFHDSLKPDTLRGPTYRFLVGESVQNWPADTYANALFACRTEGKDREALFLTFVGTKSPRILDVLDAGFEATTN